MTKWQTRKDTKSLKKIFPGVSTPLSNKILCYKVITQGLIKISILITEVEPHTPFQYDTIMVVCKKWVNYYLNNKWLKGICFDNEYKLPRNKISFSLKTTKKMADIALLDIVYDLHDNTVDIWDKNGGKRRLCFEGD